MQILEKHKILEKNATLLLIFSFLVVTIGGIVQITPLFYLENTIEKVEGVRPYTPLELVGRDIYVREGCYVCHSQMIRPMRDEVERYGHYSLAAESMYDHPFQWGSKRTGPDLAHVGGKYPNVWHYQHMNDPRSVSGGSIMPSYPWLLSDNLDTSTLVRKIEVQRTLGVPFAETTPAQIAESVAKQSKEIAADLKAAGAYVAPEKEIVAVIAYLQHLGKYEKVTPPPRVAKLND